MRPLLLAFAALATAACVRNAPAPGTAERPAGNKAPALELVAQSPRQWTGIAVSKDGRIFVNFPRWSEDVWSALTGHTLWRIPTEALLDKSLDDKALASRVEKAHTIVAPDGILFDGKVYVTTTQIHLPPAERGPYGIYRFQP